MRRRRALRVLLAALGLSFAVLAGAALAPPPRATEPAGRVVLFSWDGAAYWIAERLLDEGALPHLGRLVREGAWSDGMVTSFPTKTAPGHAMIWTGEYGHRNGITGNSLLPSPPEAHSRLERVSGFFSDGLRAVPLWVRAARAGRTTYALHATQSYPFEPSWRALDEKGRERLRLLYGYTGNTVPAAVLDAASTPPAKAAGWAIPEAEGPEAREIAFRVADRTFWGLFFDDPFDPAEGCDTLGIVRDKGETSFVARVKPGEEASFSAPISLLRRGEELWFSLRLFELDPAASRWRLYRTSAAAVASRGRFPGAGELPLEAFAGNAGGGVYVAGGLGPTIAEGGDGTAEARLFETMRHLADQLLAQMRLVFERGDAELLLLYSPLVDEASHVFVGYVDPDVPEHDPALAARVWPLLAEAYRIQDELLGAVLDEADRTGAHVLVVADHGMAGTSRRLNVNVALARAGLVGLAADGSIDLSRTKALYLPLDDTSVAVNTDDRKGGIVALEDKPAVLAALRRALEAIEDPATGERLVRAVFEPATSGLLQPGGPTTGDLFLEIAPGYDFSAATDRDEIVTRTRPQGTHIFVPTRRTMLAVAAARGPRIPPGTRWGRIRAIDIAPTVLALLGLDDEAKDLPGRSLVPPRPVATP